MRCFSFVPIDDAEPEFEENIVVIASAMNDEVHFPLGGNQAAIQITGTGK